MVADQSAEVAKLKRINAGLEKEIADMEAAHEIAMKDMVAKLAAVKSATAASSAVVV